MTYDAIITSVALVALTIATISDLKTREIPDWISYGLLFFVLATRGLQSILTRNHSHFTTALIVFMIFFIFGLLMYYTKQWGGGDTKLLTALGASFAERPAYILTQSSLQFPIILIMNLLIIGAIYGIFYAFFLAIKHRKTFQKQFIKTNQDKQIKKIKITMLILAIIIATISFMYLPLYTKLMGGMLAFIILLVPYLIATLKSIELVCMYKKVSPNHLTEGDWVQNDIYKGKKLIYKTKPYGIDSKSIEKLKKAKIKQVLIKEGIPFVPAFLIGTIITLITGKIVFLPLI